MTDSLRTAFRDLPINKKLLAGYLSIFYCVDSQGIATIHPKPDVEGGVFLQHEFVREQIQRKQGYLEYECKNPGEPVERPKALFMTYFAPGTGSFPCRRTRMNLPN